MVITGKHILHSAFYLAATLLCVAMYFILLRADFLAAVQILVYMGSIVVLILFALMLTRTKVGQETNVTNNQKVIAAFIAIILFISLTLVFSYAKIETVAENATALKISSIKDFSSILFTKYTLPFEIASILLLASLVGSIVIAMKEKQEAGSESSVEHGSITVVNIGNQSNENNTQASNVMQEAQGKQSAQGIAAGKDINGDPEGSTENAAEEAPVTGTIESTPKETFAGGTDTQDKKGKD